MPRQPPRLPEAWLGWLLPEGGAREGLLGDLHEEYLERARTGRAPGTWYWLQALGVTRHYVPLRLVRALKTPGAPAPPKGRSDSVLQTLWTDLRFAARGLARRPGFTIVTALTLGLGIGGNVALFSVVRGVVLKPLPYTEPERLVVVWENDRLRGTTREGASAPDFIDFVEMSRSFESLVARTTLDRTLGHGDRPERIRTARVSAAFFSTLGLSPILGRDFLPREEQPGRDRSVLLSESLWRRRFGASPGIVGRVVSLDEQPFTVVGVMPRHARLPGLIDQDAWEPLAFTPQERSLRGRHGYLVFGRLADGVSVPGAQQEMTALMARLEELHADDNLGRGAVVVPLHEQLVGDVRPAMLILFGATGLVLLIGCANVAHLLLARGLARQRELAIRRSLGASPMRLFQQLFTESLVLSLAAGALGVLLALGGVQLLVARGPADIPRLAEVAVDVEALEFAVAASLVTGILFGLVPAWRASFGWPPGRQLGERASTRDGGKRQLLVGAEVAVAVVLFVGAGLLIRSLDALNRVAPGYRSENLLLADLQLTGPRYPFPEGWPVHSWPEHDVFVDEILERTRRLPGIHRAVLAHQGPVSEGWTTRVSIVGRPAVPEGELDEASFRPASPGYFQTLGIPLTRGRGFTDRDRSEAPLVAVVNEAFVRRHFPGGGRILGEQIVVFGDPREIVGVAGDVKFQGLAAETVPAMYLPLHQNPMPNLTLIARTEVPASTILPTLRREIGEVDPDLALFGITTARTALDGSLAERRFHTLLLLIFAGGALGLALVGVYGVLSFVVSQRTREMGVRVALGATPHDLVTLVVGGGMRVVGAALVVGLVGSLGAARLLDSLLFGVSATDPTTLVGVAVLFAATAAVACYLPARRASRADPVAALRAE